MYKSFILTILDYCDSVWNGNCNKVDAERLERLQKRAAKVVCLSQSSDDALAVLRWKPLYKRREQHVFNLVKKSLDGAVPQFLTKYYCARQTRQSNQLHLPRVRIENAKRSFYYNGCVVYNSFIKQ